MRHEDRHIAHHPDAPHAGGIAERRPLALETELQRRLQRDVVGQIGIGHLGPAPPVAMTETLLARGVARPGGEPARLARHVGRQLGGAEEAARGTPQEWHLPGEDGLGIDRIGAPGHRHGLEQTIGHQRLHRHEAKVTRERGGAAIRRRAGPDGVQRQDLPRVEPRVPHPFEEGVGVRTQLPDRAGARETGGVQQHPRMPTTNGGHAADF